MRNVLEDVFDLVGAMALSDDDVTNDSASSA
jgi:hypothetical protein